MAWAVEFMSGRELRRLRSRLVRFRRRMMRLAGQHSDAGFERLERICMIRATQAGHALVEVQGELDRRV